MKKQLKCYIYTRVSTFMQVDGYSLDAQRDKLYDRFSDIEKKTFLKSFLEEVQIFEEEQKDGRILKSLKFRFPVLIREEFYAI